MSWKVSPKKVMVTLLLIMITVYHSMTMLYYISGMDSSFLEKRYIIGTATMILAIFIIAVFKLHRNLKMPLCLGGVLLLLFVFPIITARMNYQEIYHTLISQTLMWIPICAASYYSVLYYGEFPVSKKMLYFLYAILIGLSFPLIGIHLSGAGLNGSVIFSTYLVLTIVPLLLQATEYKSRYLPILCSLIVIAATTKRTGMLAAIIGFAVFYLTDGKSKKPIKKRLERIVKITILGSIVIAFLILVLSRFGIDVLGRFSELSSDGGSGRNIVWAKVLASFSNSDLKRKIFGHGINSVFQTVTIYSDVRIKAHNDFIETLHDYGYFGLFLLIAFIVMLFRGWYYQFREHTEQLAIYSFSMIVTIFFATFSYFFIESTVINYMAVYWGIVFAKRKLHREGLEE